MKRANCPILLFWIGFALLMGSPAFAGDLPYWIFFTDKGLSDPSQKYSALREAEFNLTERARLRRAKVFKSLLVREQDLSLNSDYLSQVANTSGIKIRKTSRWLNAVSVLASSTTLEEVSHLPFVRKITPVALRYPDRPLPADDLPFDDPQLPPRDHTFDYGNSLRQNSFLNTPELHDRGYLGSGILIGVCDAGFDNLDHRCFRDLRLEAAWDFVNNDENVADEEDRGAGQHGTRTLSIIAGLDAGRLIGTAPRASFVLAKTENTEMEDPVEEDAWVAAVEWMDSLGVDIISSSLGYIDWYNYRDLDGETGVTTIAANHATEVGIVVVNSAGNSGQNRYPAEKIVTPADGFDVFAIGALNRDSSLAGFSSHGPTYDGRIKPDFVTYGSSVIVASSSNDTNYAAGAGTSFSAPAVAGLCALLFEAMPYLTPVTMKALLREVAHNNDEPDTLYGWGIPDGLEAYRIGGREETELVIPLHRGWNTISLNLNVIRAQLFPDYLRPLVENDNLALAKDGHGRFYAPRIPFNNIPGWNLVEGYQLGMDAADTLRFEGQSINYTMPIHLTEGWQIVAFLPDFPMPVRTAMRSLTDPNALVIIKDEWGRFFYPRLDFSNLATLVPGRAYHIKLNENATLQYPRERIADGLASTEQQPTFFKLPQPGVQGMSLLIIAQGGIEDGDEAAFLDRQGNTVGAGVFDQGRCGMALWQGEQPLPMFELSVWSKRNNDVTEAVVNCVYGDVGYIPDGMSVLEASIPIPVAQSLRVNAYPTPFNNTLTVRVESSGSAEVNLKLFDLGGKLIVEKVYTSGAKNIEFDGSSLAAGVYLLKVKSGSRNITVKVVALK